MPLEGDLGSLGIAEDVQFKQWVRVRAWRHLWIVSRVSYSACGACEALACAAYICLHIRACVCAGVGLHAVRFAIAMCTSFIKCDLLRIRHIQCVWALMIETMCACAVSAITRQSHVETLGRLKFEPKKLPLAQLLLDICWCMCLSLLVNVYPSMCADVNSLEAPWRFCCQNCLLTWAQCARSLIHRSAGPMPVCVCVHAHVHESKRACRRHKVGERDREREGGREGDRKGGSWDVG